MVQFLSINFFSWISSIFVGFFKSSRFFGVTLYKAAVLDVLINKIVCILPPVIVLIAQLSVCISTFTLQLYLLSIIFLPYPEIAVIHLLRCTNKVTAEA